MRDVHYIQFPDTTHTFAHPRLNIEKRACGMPFLYTDLVRKRRIILIFNVQGIMLLF